MTTMKPSREVDDQAFRDAMSRFPSGVTIVTTTARDSWWGFTASSFCSLSIDPPLVLVCLASTAECHPVFMAAERYAIHILQPHHRELAMRFATRGADKFSGLWFYPDEHGLPVLPDARVRLLCRSRQRYPEGDHVILVGEVTDVALGNGQPVVQADRRFWKLATGESQDP